MRRHGQAPRRPQQCAGQRPRYLNCSMAIETVDHGARQTGTQLVRRLQATRASGQASPYKGADGAIRSCDALRVRRFYFFDSVKTVSKLLLSSGNFAVAFENSLLEIGDLSIAHSYCRGSLGQRSRHLIEGGELTSKNSLFCFNDEYAIPAAVAFRFTPTGRRSSAESALFCGCARLAK
jgi:hypothetical protein